MPRPTLKPWLQYWRTALRARLARRRHPRHAGPHCGICGAPIRCAQALWSDREAPSCTICGSNLRFRALIAAWASVGAANGRLPLIDLPRNERIVGLGTSDAGVYAHLLAVKYDYLNTFYHQRPKLDITAPPPAWFGRHDFLISSDVLEHVAGPPALAFANLRRLLKPGGLLALTVPYGDQPHTIEHYPDLHDYRIIDTGGRRILVNLTAAGVEQRFDTPCFHGGDGATLEMRIFSLPDLTDHLQAAGFSQIRIHAEDRPEWGIVHTHALGLPITAIAV